MYGLNIENIFKLRKGLKKTLYFGHDFEKMRSLRYCVLSL